MKNGKGIRRALLSVSDKAGLFEFAKFLKIDNGGVIFQGFKQSILPRFYFLADWFSQHLIT